MQALDRVVTDALGMPDAVGCVLAGLFADKQLGRALKDIGIVVFEGNPGSGVARGTLVLNLAHPSDYIKVAAKMFGVDPSDVSETHTRQMHKRSLKNRAQSMSNRRFCASSGRHVLPLKRVYRLCGRVGFPSIIGCFPPHWVR